MGRAGGLGLGGSRDARAWWGLGLPVSVVNDVLLLRGTHGKGAELPRGCSEALAPGKEGGGLQPTPPGGGEDGGAISL